MRKNVALLAVMLAWPVLGTLLHRVGPSTPMPAVVVVLELVLVSVVAAALYTAIADGPSSLVGLFRRRRTTR